MPELTLKERFLLECKNRVEDPQFLVVAVKLPTKAIELIVGTKQTGIKAEYYKDAYDENFCLKTNPNVRIVDFMLV